MPDAPLHNVGDVINERYELMELLGQGAMGEVFTAKDASRNGLELALKYLKHLPEKPDSLDKFKTEFAMLTHLSHPHIAKVYDLEQDEANKQFFFTSELIKGSDFMSAVRGLSVEELEELFVQALRALEYIHGNGIFHFDIKSANLLVTSPSPLAGEGRLPAVGVVAGGEGSIQEKVLRGMRYHLKLIDFGLATLRYKGILAGTPSYMAPEMVLRENPDGRADLYSLGVLVYSALAGKNPFRTGDNQVNMLNQLNLVPPPPSNENSEVPPYLDTVIMRLIEKRPSDRYQTAALAIRDLSLRSPKRYAVETEETKESYIPWDSKFIGRMAELTRIKELLLGKRSAVVAVRGASGSGKSRLMTEVKYQAQVAEWTTFFLSDPSHLDEWEKNVLSPPFAKGGSGGISPPMLVAIDDYDILTTELWGGRIEDICKKLERRIFAKQKDKQPVILIYSVIAPARQRCSGGSEAKQSPEPSEPPPFTKGGPEGISPSPLACPPEVWRGGEGRGEGASLSLDPASETVDIDLSSFTLEDIRDYLATITGIPSPPQALVEHVHTNTGGNPFVVTEVIKTLVGSGMLVDSQGRWKGTTFEDIKIDLAKMDVPANVEDRLLRDMEGVPEEARSLAQMMAVYGAPMGLIEIDFIFSSLPSPLGGEGQGEGGKKSGGSPARGVALMLVRRGLVRINTIDGTYYFTRPLLAKAIYSRMSEPDRMHWHDKIASCHPRESGVIPAVVSGDLVNSGDSRVRGNDNTVLLYHLSRGSDRTKAKSALKKLVESCTLAQKNHDAILHAQYYLEKWNDPEMRLNLARLYNRIGKYDLAIKTAEEMGSRSSPSPLACPPAVWRGGEGRGEGDISPEDTIELPETTKRHEVTALEVIGIAYLHQMNFGAARQHFLAALQMVSETSSPPFEKGGPGGIFPPPLGGEGQGEGAVPSPFMGEGKGGGASPQKLRIENFLAEVAYFEGNTDRAIEIYERTAKEQDALPRDEQLQIKNNNLGQSYFQKGEYKKAIAQLEKELELYRSIDDSRLIARTRYSLAESLRIERDFDKAKAQFDALIRHAKEVDDVEHLFRGFNGMGNLLVDAGKPAEAAEYYERALDVSMRAGYEDQSISCIANLGVVNSNTGNLKKAKEYFTTALAYLEGDRSAGGMMSQYHCRIHLELGEIYRLEKNYEEARKQLDEAAELAKLPACKGLLFWVRLTQAKIAREEGDNLAANALLADARELADTPEKLSALNLCHSE